MYYLAGWDQGSWGLLLVSWKAISDFYMLPAQGKKMIVLNFAPKTLTWQLWSHFFLPSDQLWSHFFCPEKLWLHDNFALRPTLIPFILSWKTLTSWQLWSQTNFDPIYFVLKNFDFLTTLPSDQLWSHLFCPQKLWLHDNFDPIYFVLKLTLPSKLCPQTNFVLKNFGLRLTLISNQLILYSATASIAASTVSSFSEIFKGLYNLGIWASLLCEYMWSSG